MHKWTTALFFLFFAASAHAYYSVLDTAEMTSQYRVTGSLHHYVKEGGVNLSARGDMSFTDQVGGRVIAGFGETDFYLGGMLRWQLQPDGEHQPALGFNGGLLYGKEGDISDLTFRFEPILSKKIEFETYVITPYLSVPFGYRVRSGAPGDDNNKAVWQAVAGAQFRLNRMPELQLIAEFGVEIHEAPSHLSAGAIYYFE